ncbi:MAG: 6-phosphogluconolactonase [Gammaproteobacteria bacterium]|nr:6-phosphogluconolactonase [Gammaproteobacteria bacterium]
MTALVVADTPEGLAQMLAQHLLCRLQAAAFRGETLRVALSGGRTPEAFYRILGTHSADCPWSSLEIFFSDERAVPPDHADSNYGMAYEAWLKTAASNTVIHRIRGEEGAEQAAREYQAVIRAAGTLDLILLGLGSDGHTASLFPTDPAWQAPDPVLAIPANGDRIGRVSLGLSTLAAGRERWLIAQGADKIAALRGALAADGRTPIAELMRRAPVTAWVDRTLAQGLCP